MKPFDSYSPKPLHPEADDDPRVGDRHIDTGDDCRNRAAVFVERAGRNPGQKCHLLAMAASWLRLAVRADQIQALVDRAGSERP